MNCYISGQITGLPIEEAKAHFDNAEIALKDSGFEPVNPFKLCSDLTPGATWKEYMIKDIDALFDCEAIFMLNNWGQSKGARVEYAIAQALGLSVFFEKTN